MQTKPLIAIPFVAFLLASGLTACGGGAPAADGPETTTMASPSATLSGVGPAPESYPTADMNTTGLSKKDACTAWDKIAHTSDYDATKAAVAQLISTAPKAFQEDLALVKAYNAAALAGDYGPLQDSYEEASHRLNELCGITDGYY